MTRNGSSLLIRNALVFDGIDTVSCECDIRVDQGRISEVGPGLSLGIGHDDSERQTIDAAGKVVIPGLIDAHFHAYGISLSMVECEAAPASLAVLLAAERLRNALERGFTTVRDVAGGDWGLAQAIRRGIISAPDYLYTGPALSQTGGHGDPCAPALEICCPAHRMVEVVDGADAVRRAVRQRLRNGAHAIKVMASGGVISPTDPIQIPQYTSAELAAACDEAARRGAYVATHAYSVEAIAHSLAAGVRSIEHGNLLDEATAAAMSDAGAYLVPTLATYHAMASHGRELGLDETSLAKNDEVLERGAYAVQLAERAGVRVGFGTDLMGELESAQLTGLRLQADAVGVASTLKAATSANADLLGRGDIGRIAPGYRADMVILNGNPFEDAEVLDDRRRIVIQRGQPIHS